MNPINKWALLWPVILTLLIPLVAAWFAYPGTHLPPGFGIFPPIQTSPAPGFSLIYFLVVAGLAVLVTLLLLFPKLFGFQGATPAPATATKPLPWWFWAGGVVMLCCWWVMWDRPAWLGDLVYYAFSPLWWGFIIMLDGIVYHRNNVLMRQSIWSPFTSLSQGNWAPGVLIALASMFNGFLWEMWNFGSEHPDIGYPTNPNYWIYDIPFVNVIHIFSEMPLLGYFGYLPFGALVWVFFIWIGALFSRDTDIYLNGNPN